MASSSEEEPVPDESSSMTVSSRLITAKSQKLSKKITPLVEKIKVDDLSADIASDGDEIE